MKSVHWVFEQKEDLNKGHVRAQWNNMEESRNEKVNTDNTVRIASVCRASKQVINMSRASTRDGVTISGLKS